MAGNRNGIPSVSFAQGEPVAVGIVVVVVFVVTEKTVQTAGTVESVYSSPGDYRGV